MRWDEYIFINWSAIQSILTAVLVHPHILESCIHTLLYTVRTNIFQMDEKVKCTNGFDVVIDGALEVGSQHPIRWPLLEA